jgi:hypothetical protein
VSAGQSAYFVRTPILFDCPVPVNGDGDSMRDGEPIPLEERTPKCGAKAPYLIGSQIVCEAHLRQACDLMGIEADEVIDDLETTA